MYSTTAAQIIIVIIIISYTHPKSFLLSVVLVLCKRNAFTRTSYTVTQLRYTEKKAKGACYAHMYNVHLAIHTESITPWMDTHTRMCCVHARVPECPPSAALHEYAHSRVYGGNRIHKWWCLPSLAGSTSATSMLRIVLYRGC